MREEKWSTQSFGGPLCGEYLDLFPSFMMWKDSKNGIILSAVFWKKRNKEKLPLQKNELIQTFCKHVVLRNSEENFRRCTLALVYILCTYLTKGLKWVWVLLCAQTVVCMWYQGSLLFAVVYGLIILKLYKGFPFLIFSSCFSDVGGCCSIWRVLHK